MSKKYKMGNIINGSLQNDNSSAAHAPPCRGCSLSLPQCMKLDYLMDFRAGADFACFRLDFSLYKL